MSRVQQERASQLLLEELKAIIEQDLQDPDLASVEVRAVKLAKDRRNVTVYVSHRDEAVPPERVLRALNRAKAYCRRQLAACQVLRRIPDCAFAYSRGEHAAARVHALLDSLPRDAHGS